MCQGLQPKPGLLDLLSRFGGHTSASSPAAVGLLPQKPTPGHPGGLSLSQARQCVSHCQAPRQRMGSLPGASWHEFCPTGRITGDVLQGREDRT